MNQTGTLVRRLAPAGSQERRVGRLARQRRYPTTSGRSSLVLPTAPTGPPRHPASGAPRTARRYDRWFTARRRWRGSGCGRHILSSRRNRLTSTGPTSASTSCGPTPRSSCGPCSTRAGRDPPVPRGARRHRPDQPGPPRPARHRGAGAVLRPDRPPRRRRRPATSRWTESFHIGRLGISGDDLEPLVVDWRAPVAEPFYRATGRDPMGLVLRRHLAAQGRRIVGIEDERFGRHAASTARRTPPTGSYGDADGSEATRQRRRRGTASSSSVVPAPCWPPSRGPGPGHMRDIVSTIQREQDEIIRSAAPGRPGRPGGPGHRQDGGGAAPGRLPSLYPPLPPRAPGRARHRARTPSSCATSSTSCRPWARAGSPCPPSRAWSTASRSTGRGRPRRWPA